MLETTFARYNNIQTLLLDDWNSIFVEFRDPSGDYTNVTGARVNITSERFDPSDPGRFVVSGAALFTVTTGIYGYTLNPDVLEPGMYAVEFLGTLTSGLAPAYPYENVTLPSDLRILGQFRVSEATPEMDMVIRVRRRLKDLNTRLYRLDLPTQKWTDEEILDAVYKAVDELNTTPPMHTSYSLATLPHYSWVEDWAFSDLLESIAVLENWNTMTMGDGAASLSLNRANLFLQIANGVRSRTDQKVLRWKQSLVPHIWGQGTNQYPFRIRHVISFLPGYKNIFGG